MVVLRSPGVRLFIIVHYSFNVFQGIETWMDVDDMTKKKDLITQRMAEAVEEAAVVIIAVSKNYFNSRNCKRGKS